MRTLSLMLIAISFGMPAQAQNDCANVEYQNHNMIDYGPLAVRSLAGVTEDKQHFPIGEVCVAVFSDSTDHRMIALTRVGKDGHYALPHLPDGEYRVVATYRSFCAANVPIVVSGKAKARTLRIVMEPRGIDTCSYGELK